MNLQTGTNNAVCAGTSVAIPMQPFRSVHRCPEAFALFRQQRARPRSGLLK